MNLLHLLLAVFLLSISTALANNQLLDTSSVAIVDAREGEYLHREGEYNVRLADPGDFLNSERRFQQHGDLSDADTRKRLADTLKRHAETQKSYDSFLRSHGVKTDDEAADASEMDATGCTESPEAEKQAFRDAAVLDGGTTVAESMAFDFSCDNGDGISQIADADDNGTVAGTSGDGSTSPIGDYKLTWQSDGEGWNTNEPFYDGGHSGYGDAWDEGGTNVSHANGVTTLKLTRCNKGGKEMCGAEITTRGKKEFKHGYVEVEARTTDSKGSFPAALWFMGDGQWPESGEIDVHETVKNGSDNSKVFFSTHWSGCGGKCQISDSNPATVNNMNEWNTYGVKRTRDRIEQYVNGEKTGEITRAEAAAKGGNYQVIFDKAMHIRADIGSGGTWAKHSSGKADEGELQIKNVKVYE